MIQVTGYTVRGRLGSGAQSRIYSVSDESGNLFALKHVVRESADDQRFIDQAICEHEIASQFDHPVLRRSHKLIKSRLLWRVRELHVVMEMVEGKNLEESHISDPATLCDLFVQAAQGLHHLHEAGFVHADIKPNNIMVTPEGAVKIIDFGQSCPVGTIKQRIQGTPDYIAPEQVTRQAITPQTDVFNLGASLYRMLTGKSIPTMIPQSGRGTSLQMEAAIAPPEQVKEAICPALSRLVMDCIHTEPRERPANMQRVIERLKVAHRYQRDVSQ